jgi:hypothetical protein
MNNFVLDKGIDGLGFSHIVGNGLQPKRLNEFWNDLKEQGFHVPSQYCSPKEKIETSFNSSKGSDDLPF